MKQITNRRAFLRNLSQGVLTGVFAFGYFKLGKSFGLIPAHGQVENEIPRINPAFMVNVLNDGTVEMYTHKPGGEKVVYPFKGFEADIITNILQNRDPRLYTWELGSRYNLKEGDFISLVESTLKSMEQKGLIYYGDNMLVKVKEASNE